MTDNPPHDYDVYSAEEARLEAEYEAGCQAAEAQAEKLRGMYEELMSSLKAIYEEEGVADEWRALSLEERFKD